MKREDVLTVMCSPNPGFSLSLTHKFSIYVCKSSNAISITMSLFSQGGHLRITQIWYRDLGQNQQKIVDRISRKTNGKDWIWKKSACSAEDNLEAQCKHVNLSLGGGGNRTPNSWHRRMLIHGTVHGLIFYAYTIYFNPLSYSKYIILYRSALQTNVSSLTFTWGTYKPLQCVKLFCLMLATHVFSVKTHTLHITL